MLEWASAYFARDAFVRERDFAFFHGTAGYIRDTGFLIFHGTQDTGDFAFCTGPRDTGYEISHFARDHGIIPNPVQFRGIFPAGKIPGKAPEILATGTLEKRETGTGLGTPPRVPRHIPRKAGSISSLYGAKTTNGLKAKQSLFATSKDLGRPRAKR